MAGWQAPVGGWDAAVLAGVAGLCTAIGAVIKTVLDWRSDRGRQRSTSEDLVRDDLLKMLSDQRVELLSLRAELTEARRELLAEAEDARIRLRACEDRAVMFQAELAKVKAMLRQQAARDAERGMESGQ